MSDQTDQLTPNRKALRINLDELKYGTFAEIGAGQEVARVFFQAGGAAGTIAKSMSAYDMTFSDMIYGKAPRYVSHERLELMLNHEYKLLNERLGEKRGDTTTFFVFADTVAARNFKGTNECHGWLGIRFQTEPHGPPSDIMIHVRMWDKDNLLQQQALGIVGTNLIYGAFYLRDQPESLIKSLLDAVGPERIEVDMLRMTGPAFGAIDNRLMSLHLVRHKLTNAVMFGNGGRVLQPSEFLYKKAVLVERGSFRPVTLVNADMLACACAQFMQEPRVQNQELVLLMEITMNNLLASGELDSTDFLSRVDLLGAIGFNVLISDYSEYYRLIAYFRRYTQEMIGVALGVSSLRSIFNEKYYEQLPGGILESFGRLFKNGVKLYIYPMKAHDYESHLPAESISGFSAITASPAVAGNELITAENLPVDPHLRHLYAHLMENHYIESIKGFSSKIMGIYSRDVLQRISSGDSTWEAMVPRPVADAIKERRLFGYTPAVAAS
jgi:hypothetical protein